jgi:general secretion pathway protein G
MSPAASAAKAFTCASHRLPALRLDDAEKRHYRGFVHRRSAWVPATHASVTPLRDVFRIVAWRVARSRAGMSMRQAREQGGSTDRGRVLRVEGSRRGFTLIELLVVMTLIVVIAGIGLATYSTSITKSKEAVLKEDLFRMRDAIDQYHADKGSYPASLESLVSEGYMRRVPEDPFTSSSTTWQTTPAEFDPTNPTADVGIFDVKSGSDQTALDGSRYSDW